jgi:hypothetical protein
MTEQQQHTTTSNVDDDIEVPMINEYEYQATAFFAAAVSSLLDLIQGPATNLLPNSGKLHFRCNQCRHSVYVHEQFRLFHNFPICINCAIESLREHR